MGELFIGHGSLDPPGQSYQEGMGIVAIPPDTTLQFYTDAGQELRLGDLPTALSHLRAPWPALTSENVTYNFSMSALPMDTAADRWETALWNSNHTPHMPGWDLDDPILLCNGSQDQCPTNPHDRKPHTCSGILAMYTGELHWMACTSFPLDDEETLNTLDVVFSEEDRPTSAYLNSDPDNRAEQTARLLAVVRPMFENYRYFDRMPEFVEYVKSDQFTPDEREAIRAADPEIAAVVPPNV